MRILWIILLALLMSCNGSPPAQAEGTQNPDTSVTDPADNTDPEPETVYTAYFSGARAWDYLTQQVDMGFRVPGTVTHLECRRWLQKELGKYCEVELQEFIRQLPPDLEDVKMWNIIGRINPEAERRILLAAHWDTRPTADYNPTGERDQPIAGANDGASGVAVLLELARVFSEVPPAVGVDILLTDGEDYGPGTSTMFMGAEYFASQLTINDVGQYNYGILLDMIGDKNLDIHPEYYSEADAGLIYAVAVQYAEAMGYLCFKVSGGYRIMDDHLSISERGIRIYDFIDFNYEYWHTTEDTADKCSADSLEAVGRVIENMIYLAPEIYGADDQKSRPRYAR
ncbi:M28 family peptidase [bacterium]|nr:M28 family peptidase [bacterium]